jgi:C_GCAxxG_C_C family probable redox protein
LLAVAEQRNIHSELIPRIATGFCSGMARTGGLCGAISGGVMAIGLHLGRDKPTDSVDPCYQAVRSLMNRFTDRFQAITCLELTGVHLGTPEGQAAFRDKGQISHCYDYVAEVTRLVMEAIDQPLNS